MLVHCRRRSLSIVSGVKRSSTEASSLRRRYRRNRNFAVFAIYWCRWRPIGYTMRRLCFPREQFSTIMLLVCMCIMYAVSRLLVVLLLFCRSHFYFVYSENAIVKYSWLYVCHGYIRACVRAYVRVRVLVRFMLLYVSNILMSTHCLIPVILSLYPEFRFIYQFKSTYQSLLSVFAAPVRQRRSCSRDRSVPSLPACQLPGTVALATLVVRY